MPRPGFFGRRSMPNGLRALVVGGLTLLLVGLSQQYVVAATLNWDLNPPAAGDWFLATNWSTDVVPISSDTAYIDNQGTALISSGTAAASALYLGQSAFGNLTQ